MFTPNSENPIQTPIKSIENMRASALKRPKTSMETTK
jgi:hypothetical protein